MIEQNAPHAQTIELLGRRRSAPPLTMTGPGQQLLNDPKVRAAYLGE